jgi:hypothetical protein
MWTIRLKWCFCICSSLFDNGTVEILSFFFPLEGNESLFPKRNNILSLFWFGCVCVWVTSVSYWQFIFRTSLSPLADRFAPRGLDMMRSEAISRWCPQKHAERQATRSGLSRGRPILQIFPCGLRAGGATPVLRGSWPSHHHATPWLLTHNQN